MADPERRTFGRRAFLKAAAAVGTALVIHPLAALAQETEDDNMVAGVTLAAAPVDTAPSADILNLQRLPDFGISVINNGSKRYFEGRFFPTLDSFPKGYMITDSELPFWFIYNQQEGTQTLGNPISRRWEENGVVKQAYEGGIMAVEQGTTVHRTFKNGLPVNTLISPSDSPGFEILPLSDIPAQVSQPEYWPSMQQINADSIEELRLSIPDGYRLEHFQRVAEISGLSVYQLFIDIQTQYRRERNGEPMPLPWIEPELWNVWASQAGMETWRLMMKAGFGADGDKPEDAVNDPLNIRALNAANKARAENGVPPAFLETGLAMTARHRAVTGAFLNRKGHWRFPDDPGFIAAGAPEEAKFFGAKTRDAAENTGPSTTPEWDINAYMTQDPHHRDIVLVNDVFRGRVDPTFMGYAQAFMVGQYPIQTASSLVVGTRDARVK